MSEKKKEKQKESSIADLTFHPAPDGRRQFHEQQWYTTQLSNIFIIILAITIQSKD
jgi:hypothetical protein